MSSPIALCVLPALHVLTHLGQAKHCDLAQSLGFGDICEVLWRRMLVSLESRLLVSEGR
jgi:hypothetical protein